jgi:hypothetical protein
MITSGEYSSDNMNAFVSYLTNAGVTSDIIQFDSSITDNIMNDRILDEEYIFHKNNYLIQTNNRALQELHDVDTVLGRSIYQIHQLNIGINRLLEYETQNHMKFDTVMKTRFDLWYHQDFCPILPSRDTLDAETILTLNDTVKQVFRSRGICASSNEFKDFLKSQSIQMPNYTVPDNILSISLGGKYLSNYHAIESVLNGKRNILYSFNDYMIFGNRDDFVKLQDLIYEYGKLRYEGLSLYHYYAAEANYLMFCFKHDITPIMYLEDYLCKIIR